MPNTNLPFDDDTMTLIMGLGEPSKPGQHGRSMIPAPENSAIDTITQIRDLCEDFLRTAGKEENEDMKDESSDKPRNKSEKGGNDPDIIEVEEDEEDK